MWTWLWDLLTKELFWAFVGAMATVVAAYGIFQAARQLRLDALMKAQEIWTNGVLTAARGRIFASLDAPDRGWTSEEEQEAIEVCRKNG